MEDIDCSGSARPTRCLALLPVAIGLAANSRPPRAENVIEGRFENPQTTFCVAGGGTHWSRSRDVHANNDHTRYGLTSYGTRWLLLSANASDAQTIGRAFTMGATYHLALACADVFGHHGQCLTISVSGGAVARGTYPIPANTSPGGELSFVNCGLDFTPFSDTSVMISLAHSSSGEGADGHPARMVPSRAASNPGSWASVARVRSAENTRFLPG